MAAGPGSWNDSTFVLSVLGNLSDGSGLTRFSFGHTILTFASLTAWANHHWGNTGELRFGMTIPPVPGIPELKDGITVDPPLFEAGVAVSVRI